jgi:Tfp pilus assembly protein PilF
VEVDPAPAADDGMAGVFREARELDDYYFQADVLTNLGDTHLAAGDRDLARAAWQEALGLLGELGHPSADALLARLTRYPEGERTDDGVVAATAE